MFNISRNGDIEITRGDTVEFSLSPYFNTNYNHGGFHKGPLTFQAGDKILFHILEPNKPFEYPLTSCNFEIEEETQDFAVRINHSDTVHLPPFTYYYEVKLIREVEEGKEPFVITIIPRRKFIVE